MLMYRILQQSAVRLAWRPKFESSSIGRNAVKTYFKSDVTRTRSIHSSRRVMCLADGGGGSHRPTPFHRKVLVWTKVYPSEAKIPEKITRSQMKNAMDKFRVKVSIGMVAMTFISCALMALVGRKARSEGQTVTKLGLSKREG